MSPSYEEVEERLSRSYGAFVGDIPEHPPVSWSVYAASPGGMKRHWHRVVGVAASIVLIVLATALWASPSAGARYRGAEDAQGRPPGVAQLQRTHICPCSSTL